jgi:rod shape-determining protein MreC
VARNVRGNQRGVGVLLALLLCGGLNALHNHNQRTSGSDAVTGIVRDAAIMPAQTATVRVGRWFRDDIMSIFNGPRLVSQNARLRERVLALSVQNKQLADAQAENDRLRDLLDFKRRSPRPLLAAEVTALKPTPVSDTAVLNRGLADGVRLHSVVVDANGALVGQVIDVSSHSCTTLLLTDSMSSVGAQVLTGGSQPPVGICRGLGAGQACLTYIKIDADIKPGEALSTSNLGSIFPPGIPIGTVVSIKTDTTESMKTAVIHPSADLDHLDLCSIYPSAAKL